MDTYNYLQILPTTLYEINMSVGIEGVGGGG